MDLCNSASKGIYFSCNGCSRCCSEDQEGYVFVYMEDIMNLQKFFKISLHDLAKQYLSITSFEYTIWDQNLDDSGNKITLEALVLDYEKSSDCLFLEQGKNRRLCTIYDFRPLQCRLYPFWSMVMESEFEFHMHKINCPGLSDKGNFYSKEDIEKLIYSERKLEHNYVKAMSEVDNDIRKMYPFL